MKKKQKAKSRKQKPVTHPVFEVVPTPWGVINCNTSLMRRKLYWNTWEVKLSDLERDFRFKAGDIIIVGEESP